ncbi:MAG: DsbA family protein [Aquabacterium sp.]
MKLVFVADPMCSWCYGFAKELTALQELHPSLPLEIRVGGVRAGETEVMTDELKHFRLGHWGRVEAVSGLPFNREAFMALRDFVYDTEPVCRAIVTVRKLAPSIPQLPVFRAIQRAFYVEGLDTTDEGVLAVAAVVEMKLLGQQITPAQFQEVWRDPATIAETAAEFKMVRRWGISSFPALLAENKGELSMISPGYASVRDIQARLKPLLMSATA